MQLVLLADIHSNLEALLQVQKKIRELSPDKVICLGDIVGYGAKPSECIQIVRENYYLAVAGNHEYGVLGKKDLSFFNPYAREAILWTRAKLSSSDELYLRSLELIYQDKNFLGVHASLYEPSEFHYLDNYSYIFRDFKVLEESRFKLSFVAHTHIPFVFFYKGGNLYRDYSSCIELNPKSYYIINVGSVGQPRDRDNRACLCVVNFDKGIVKFERLEYNIKKTQQEIKSAGLPLILAKRLKEGW